MELTGTGKTGSGQPGLELRLNQLRHWLPSWGSCAVEENLEVGTVHSDEGPLADAFHLLGQPFRADFHPADRQRVAPLGRGLRHAGGEKRQDSDQGNQRRVALQAAEVAGHTAFSFQQSAFSSQQSAVSLDRYVKPSGKKKTNSSER
jgi:hypothetical protein